MSFSEYISLSNPIYDEITNKIRNSYKNACILYIEKIINYTLLDNYEKRKESMPDVKEYQLFHGTKSVNIRSIADNGFQTKYNKTSAYGIGTYFSTKPEYSMFHYTNIDKSGISYVFLCDVLVGKCQKGSQNLTITADNAVDKVTNPSIYVTPHDDACYPKYLVAFHKNATTQ
jgi:hypothetical protein